MNRFLDAKKLAEVRYCHCPANMSLKDFEKRYRLPPKASINIVGSIRTMEKKDLAAVYKLFNEQTEK